MSRKLDTLLVPDVQPAEGMEEARGTAFSRSLVMHALLQGVCLVLDSHPQKQG